MTTVERSELEEEARWWKQQQRFVRLIWRYQLIQAQSKNVVPLWAETNEWKETR